MRKLMIWEQKVLSLGDWMGRLPWWLQIVLIPPMTPLFIVAAAYSCCPRTTAFSAATLVAVYVPLIRSGAFSWEWALQSFEGIYGAFMMLGVFGVLEAWADQAKARWTGEQKPKEEIDGNNRS